MFMYYPISFPTVFPVKLTLETLHKFKERIDLMNLNQKRPIKVNISQIARELGVDRRTAARYYHEGPPVKNRNRKHLASAYEKEITALLSPSSEDAPKSFAYIRHLYHYMQDTYGMKVSESAFRRYIFSKPEFAAYFGKSQAVTSNRPTVRYETSPGDLAQIDWKESIPMKVTDPELPMLFVNVFVLKLAYSRKTVLHLTIQRTQDILLSSLTESFEILGGVPKRIMVDNMKTVMDEPRTRCSPGKVNGRFQEFAKDFGFEVVPCIARRPQTKGKVESFMKILDELSAYFGQLSFKELVEKVNQIGQRYNMTPNQAIGEIPDKVFNEKEKSLLLPLPRKQIRDSYKILKGRGKVNRSSLVHYQGNQYSVPPQYVGKVVTFSVFEESLYIYHNTELIAIHTIYEGKRQKIFTPAHEKAIWEAAFPGMPTENYRDITKNNLSQLGALYRDDQ